MEDSESQYERLFAFETLLDGSRHAEEKVVDKAALRDLCRDGIPDHPPHLRPLAYSLLLGILPLDKREWKQTWRNQRLHYYSLVKSQMEAIESMPPPKDSPHPHDKLLKLISQDVVNLTARFTFLRHRAVLHASSPLAPPKSRDLDPTLLDPEDESFIDAYASSSSDDDEDDERHARSKDATVDASRPMRRLLCRRAAVNRLEAIASDQYRRHQADEQSPATIAEGPGRFRKHPGSASSSSRRFSSVDSSISSAGSSSSPAAPLLETPQLSLSLAISDNDHPHDTTPSIPITLLSPRPIPSAGSTGFDTSISGSLLHSDSHAEVLIRLLYTFSIANSQWTYHQGLAELVIVLYIVYLELDYHSIDVKRRRRKSSKIPESVLSTGKRAEEQTYWALCTLVREFEAVIVGPSSQRKPVVDVPECLECLGRRLEWADEPLRSALRSNDLDPSSPVYASRWITLLLARDLSSAYLIPAWDYLFSSHPMSETPLDRLDSLLDLCTALLILNRKILLGRDVRISLPKSGQADGLWSDDAETLNSEFDPGRQLSLLRALPMDVVCQPQELLAIAKKIRLARQADRTLDLSYDGKAGDQWSILGSGSKSFQQYADMEKVGAWSRSYALWASGALTKAAERATTSPVGKPSSLLPTVRAYVQRWAPTPVSNHETMPADSSDVAARSGDADSHPHHTPPSHAVKAERDFSNRQRSESSTSAFSVSSIQDRLAGLTATLTSPETPPSKRSSLQPMGPKPLLLSGSARRASTTVPMNQQRRGSSPISTPSRLPSPPSGSLSPPAAIHGDYIERPAISIGLYRIGSRQGNNSSRTSLPVD